MSRFRPASPLAQNTQPIAQPTWVEMQIVLREWSRPTPSCGARMMTVSMSERSSSSRRSLSVTSAECLLRTSDGRHERERRRPARRAAASAGWSCRPRSARASCRPSRGPAPRGRASRRAPAREAVERLERLARQRALRGRELHRGGRIALLRALTIALIEASSMFVSMPGAEVRGAALHLDLDVADRPRLGARRRASARSS